MSWLQAIILGVVQGLTEFLPVSSSAHLILAPRLLGWPDQGLDADLAAHLGTFLAVAVYFRRDLSEILAGGLDALRGDRARGRLAWILIVGTLPLVVVGLLLAHWAETAARDPRIIIASSIGFGVLLAVADLWGRRQRNLHGVTTADGVWVGLAQTLAAVPGTSRSGITITAGLFRGLDRASAARFSFLLAVPAMLLVAAKHVLDVALGKVPLGELGPQALLFAVSALVGFLVIAWLLRYLQRGSLMGFVVYRIALGVVVLVLWLRGGL